MRTRIALLAIVSVAFGCTPGFELEILNNTSHELRLVLQWYNGTSEVFTVRPHGEVTLPGRFKEHRIESELGVWRYGAFPRLPQEFFQSRRFRLYNFVQLQVEADGSILIANSKTELPLSAEVEQPEGFPIRPEEQPRAGATPPNKPLKLSAAGFSRAPGRGRHEAW